MKNNSKGIIYGIISSATFGMIPFFSIPIMDGGMSSKSILFYRFFLSAIVMGAIVFLRRHTIKVSAKQALNLAILGFMYSATANLLIESYKYLSSGLATGIHFLYPAMVTLTMTLVYKEKNNILMYIGILMAVGGVALICMGEGFEKIDIKGLLLAISTIFTYALFIVGINKNKSVCNIDGHVVTFYVLLTGAILFMSTSIINKGIIEIPFRLQDIINLILLAIIPTMVSDLTLVLAIKNVGSTVTSVLGSMEPITAMVLGVIFFNELLTPYHIIGMAIVVLAISLVIIASKIKK